MNPGITGRLRHYETPRIFIMVLTGGRETFILCYGMGDRICLRSDVAYAISSLHDFYGFNYPSFLKGKWQISFRIDNEIKFATTLT